MTTQEQRWAAAELDLDVQSGRRIRRTPGVVIGITGLLVLAVGITAAVDLRRLHTPRGAALAWAEAATFGDCRAFLALSRPTEPDLEHRSDDEICQALRRSTRPVRNDPSRTRVRAASVQRRGRTATVTVDVTGPNGVRNVALHLVERGDDWLVLREPGTCGDVPCY